jgi:serine/threonine-protein kinase RsbW
MSGAEATLPLGGCSLTLTNDASSAALACALARAFSGQLGFDAHELDQIELGVEEAVSNVVRHAFPPGELHTFDVVYQPSTLGLEILIRDQGQPFDPSRIPDYDPQAAPDAQLEAGLGMHLIRRAFDRVDHRNLGRGGKETRLLKHRELSPIGERPLAAASHDSVEAVSAIRLLRAEDALDVSRCIHEAYGYSYPYEHIYFPERIVALNEAGQLCSALAVTPSGRVAGHAALVVDDAQPDRAELAIVVTRIEYRGQGVARKLGDFLVDQARARGMRLLFTHAVTAHPFTQRFMHQLGFRDCAILPGHAPSSLRFRKIAEALGQRESCVLSVRFLDDARPSERLAVAPAEHRAMLEAIYENLGVPLRWMEAPPETAELPPHAGIDTSVHTGLELATLEVRSWGADALPVLRARLAQLRRERMAVVELKLPLCDPHTARVLPEVETLGFVFSGASPGVEPREDRLVLDFVADPGFDYDAPKIHSPLGSRLRDYARAIAERR